MSTELDPRAPSTPSFATDARRTARRDGHDTSGAAAPTSEPRQTGLAWLRLGGRLALWARRLVGEALAQAYRVVADRRSLAGLLAGASTGASTAHLDGSPGGAADTDAAPPAELGDIGRMLARITDAHAQRMAALGLAS